MVVHKSWLSLGYTVAAAEENWLSVEEEDGGEMRTRWWGRKSENQKALRCFWFSFLLCPALVEFPTHNNNNNWNRECRCRRDGFPVDTPAFKKKKKKEKEKEKKCVAQRNQFIPKICHRLMTPTPFCCGHREREKKINKYFSSSSSSFSLLDYKTWRKHNNTNKTKKKKKNSKIAAIFFLVCPPLLLVYNNNNIPNCNTAVMAVADRPGKLLT